MPSIDPERCPPDPEETAEEYVLGKLSQADAVAFEEHYLACPTCAKIVEDTQEYVRAMRAAAKRLPPET